MLQLGEFEAAIKNLLQASEFYPENAEIEFRFAGLYNILSEERKAIFHLKNGLKFNREFVIIIEELFPNFYARPSVKQIIEKHKNPSL